MIVESKGEVDQMRIGVSIPSKRWPDDGPISYSEMAEWATHAAELGFETLWASDHFYVDVEDGRRLPSPDPVTVLSYLAGRLDRVRLGTLVLGSPFRSPGQTAREARTLAELSGGRFILGVGAGWHEPEFKAFDLPFERRVSRFEEYLEVTTRLVRGETVTHEGRYFTLREAQIVGGATPPLWVAGAGPRLISLAGRFADGWNPNGPPERFPEHVATLRREASAAGRDPARISIGGGHRALVLSDAERQSLFGDETPDFPVTAEAVAATVERYRSDGWDEVLLHLSGKIWASYREDQLQRVAEVLGLDRR